MAFRRGWCCGGGCGAAVRHGADDVSFRSCFLVLGVLS